MISLITSESRAPRFQPRSAFLPIPGQQHADVENARPDFGPCPCCGQREAEYCIAACPMEDPLGGGAEAVRRMPRCARCCWAVKRGVVVHSNRVGVLVGRGVRHGLSRDGTLCGAGSAGNLHILDGFPW